MSFRDNKAFWESFIELYKSYPCIWNVKSKEYGNRNKRVDAYKALVIKCKEIGPEPDVKFVRKKIDSLRAGFHRELREIRKSKRTGTAADSIYEPTLWYFQLLLFTRDQEEIRSGTSSMAIEELDSDDEDRIHTIELEDSVLSPVTPTSSSSEQTRRSEKNKTGPVKATTLAQKKANFLDAASIALAAVPPESSPYDPFGKSVSCDLESMETHQRTVAQKLISDILYYGKLGRLTENCSVNIPHTPLYHHGRYDPYLPYHQQPQHQQPEYPNTSTSNNELSQFISFNNNSGTNI